MSDSSYEQIQAREDKREASIADLRKRIVEMEVNERSNKGNSIGRQYARAVKEMKTELYRLEHEFD